MQRRSLWFLVAIAGVGLMLLGCGGGLLALTLTITEGEPLTGVETMPIAGIVGWGFGFGIPLMLHGVAGWRGRSSRPFSPPRVWGLWLVWMLLLGLGTAISFFSWAPPYLLPPVHVLAMSLPPLIILWLVGRALGEATGSWREVVAVMVGGSSLGLGLSLVGEMLVGLALVAVVGVAALMMPGGQERILALVRDLQNSAWLADFANLARLLLSPVVAISVLGMLSILVPLIEEGFKTLAAGVVARWTKPHPARAFLWGVASGAGFALAENLFNGALGGGEAWAMGAVTRLGATVMHCATGGLVGWGWGEMMVVKSLTKDSRQRLVRNCRRLRGTLSG